MNSTFFEQIKGSFSFLSTAGTKEVYNTIYKTRQFPFFFIIQTLWCCYLAKKSFLFSEKPKQTQEKKILRLIMQFVLALVLVFSSREIVAILTKKKSPLRSNPKQMFVFIIIFALFNFIPYHLFYRIVDVLYYFLGLLQGINQMRLFIHTIAYSNTGHIYQTYGMKYILATISIIFEYVVESSMRRIMKTAETNVSNNRVIIKTIAICVLYVGCLHAEAIKSDLTKDHLLDVLFGAFLGIANAAVIL